MTEYCSGGRLGELSAKQQIANLDELPGLLAALVDLPIGSHLAPDRSGFIIAYASIASRPEADGLPAAGEVLRLLRAQTERPMHGDFHPSNVLLDGNKIRVVDFETYGMDVAGLDIVRMAFNPMLGIEADTRRSLARAMAAAIDWPGQVPTDRDLAVCCVYWAVSCAAYFSSVLLEDPNVGEHSPEAFALASAPLGLASEFWNCAL